MGEDTNERDVSLGGRVGERGRAGVRVQRVDNGGARVTPTIGSASRDRLHLIVTPCVP